MRDNKTVIYGSSYDRGLEHLLKIWPDVKKAVPDAKLRVFYGWNLFDKVYGNNPQSQAWKAKMNEMMEHDGVTHLGRISHEACVQEHKNAGIWAYPTHFGEISCITAMRAQAYGSIPVVINYAALEETVQHGVKVSGDIYDEEVAEKFKKELISILKDDKRQEKIRPKMMKWAQKHYTWARVAKQWDEEFRSPPTLRKQVEELLEDNQALKAWDLVKDTDSPLKDRLWLRVKHAFNKEDYIKYYSEDLTENPASEEIILQADRLYPRFRWVMEKLFKDTPKTLVDLGCADGVLGLTLASKGVEVTGVNLYRPSVKLANERAKKHNIPAKFVAKDIFDYKGKHDVVVMQEVLEHLPDPQKGVDHAMSLADRGYFSTPRTDHVGVEQHKAERGKGSWDDGKPAGHLRLFTEEEFKDLFKNYEITDFYVDEERCMNVEVKNVRD